METLVMAAQFFLGLSFLVGVHELGHLLAAKMFGMRVEKFFIGFPPKVVGFQMGETEYALGSIPLGGFVKISGMIDESMDKDQMKQEPQPWEFRSKPAWQRLIVMLGGIIVNVVTGIMIFTGIVYFVGESYISLEEGNKYGGIRVNELGESIGLQNGDKVLNINGQEVPSFFDLMNPLHLMEDDSYYTVLRDGQEQKVNIPVDFLDQFADAKKDQAGNYITPALPYKITNVIAGDGAQKAGIKEGDKILEVAGEKAEYFIDLQLILAKHKEKEVDVKFLSGGQEKTAKVEVSPQGTIGVQVEMLCDYTFKQYSLAEAIPMGTTKSFNVIWGQVKAFGKMFSGEINPAKSLSGPIGIAKFFGGTWNWLKFWTVTGMLSMVLAFMNLLPIPALDGGHVVFLSYEIITGRPAPEKVLEVAQQVGMVIILLLMAFAFGKDIYDLVIDWMG